MDYYIAIASDDVIPLHLHEKHTPPSVTASAATSRPEPWPTPSHSANGISSPARWMALVAPFTFISMVWIKPSTPQVDTAFQVTNYVRCGALLTGTPGTTGGLCFNGLMDEVRIENITRPPAWVCASWATVANSAFTTYGPIVPPAVTLQVQNIGGQVVLTWTSGTLQSASAVSGPYSDMTGASSPYELVPPGVRSTSGSGCVRVTNTST